MERGTGHGERGIGKRVLAAAALVALNSPPDCVTDDEAKLMREIAREVAK